jgi:hypothetical protein
MRRYAPVLFALLSALFLLERAVSGGMFGPIDPVVVGLGTVAPLGPGAACLPRDELLVTLARAGARLEPEPVPFCTDRPDLTDWVLASESTGLRHLAFDAEGCLAIWHPATGCP